MSKQNSEKAGLPDVWHVIVCEVRSGAPWPVGTIRIREDGHAVLEDGRAGVLFGPLMGATRRVARALADQTMREALLEEMAAAGENRSERSDGANGDGEEGRA
jgi:hypothetical protein